MRKYLNTLFVTTQGAYLKKEGQSVVVTVERETKIRIPIHTLGSIVCFGNVMCSPFLMRHCAENSVFISFLSEYGRFLARVQGPVSGNVMLRREQYRQADDQEGSMRVARAIVTAKTCNARTVCQRALRDHGEDGSMKTVEIAVRDLARIVKTIEKVNDLNKLRGVEGEASRTYFAAFDHLIRAQKQDFAFTKRSRRPPMDNINALLSFVYTLLVHDCEAALEAVGLDPQVGFLHRDRSGRPSLALDLMEEFRAFFADRLVLSLVNLKQVQGKGFRKTESGAVEMDDETRKTVIVAYQKRKQEEMNHPFLNENASLGIFFHLQAMLLARYLRGDLDGYPPIITR